MCNYLTQNLISDCQVCDFHAYRGDRNSRHYGVIKEILEPPNEAEFSDVLYWVFIIGSCISAAYYNLFFFFL